VNDERPFAVCANAAHLPTSCPIQSRLRIILRRDGYSGTLASSNMNDLLIGLVMIKDLSLSS